jgi:hypothetical protein
MNSTTGYGGHTNSVLECQWRSSRSGMAILNNPLFWLAIAGLLFLIFDEIGARESNDNRE